MFPLGIERETELDVRPRIGGTDDRRGVRVQLAPFVRERLHAGEDDGGVGGDVGQDGAERVGRGFAERDDEVVAARDDLVLFHAEFFIPAGLVLVVQGVELDDLALEHDGARGEGVEKCPGHVGADFARGLLGEDQQDVEVASVSGTGRRGKDQKRDQQQKKRQTAESPGPIVRAYGVSRFFSEMETDVHGETPLSVTGLLLVKSDSSSAETRPNPPRDRTLPFDNLQHKIRIASRKNEKRCFFSEILVFFF